MDFEKIKNNICLETEIGSGAYGTGDPSREDVDISAIAIEPLEYLLALKKWDKCYSHRPGRGPQDPSGPGDLDYLVYPLKHWMKLALNANPTALMLLWPEPHKSNEFGRYLRQNANRFVSKRIFNTYIGYAENQRRKLITRQNPSRADIIEKYGWDTKFGMHSIRLLMQGIELSQTGKVEVPIPSPNRETLISIRMGEVTADDTMKLFDEKLDELRSLEDSLQLPDSPDFEWANKTLMGEYCRFHGNRLYLISEEFIDCELFPSEEG